MSKRAFEVLCACALVAPPALGPARASAAAISIYDDFNDGSITDGAPVQWTVRQDRGVFNASSGDLRVSGTVAGIEAFVPQKTSGREEVRTQVRMESAATCYALVIARGNFAIQGGYFAGLGSDGWLSIERYPNPGILVNSGMWVEKDQDYIIELIVRPEVREEDEGVVLELRVWKEGTERPESPNLQTWDPHPLPPGFPGLCMSMFAGGVPGTACFRYFGATGELAPPACVSIDDDFDDGSIMDGNPVGWTHRRNQGVFDATSGDLRVSGNVDTLWAGVLAMFSGGETLRTQVRTESAATCYSWVFARTNLSTGAAYFGSLGSDGWLSIERYPGPGIAVSSSMPVEKGQDYVIELQIRPEVRSGGEGDLLELRAWKAEAERPALPSLEWWDTDPLPEGFPGLGMSMFAGGVPGTATFRYFSATACPPPTAALTITPETGAAPLEIIGDGSGSFAAGDGEIVKYDWDFGDGETGTGEEAHHTYQEAGQYFVRLTVTDDQGATASATEMVRVGCPSGDVSPWVPADIGDPPWSGSAWLDKGGLQVCAGGKGFSGTNDEGYFLYQEIAGDFRITARIAEIDTQSAVSRVGVMIRDSLDPKARVGTVLVQASAIPDQRRARVYHRKVSSDTMRSLALEPAVEGAQLWVRLDRQGERVIASASPDGVNWSNVDVPFDAPLPATVLVGVTACYGTVSTTGSETTVRATLTDLDLEGTHSFKRGDTNGDGAFDIGDAIYNLNYQFASGPAPTCLKTADVNDDGRIDIGDPVNWLNCMFASGPAPLAPHPGCGADPTDDGLSCEGYSACGEP